MTEAQKHFPGRHDDIVAAAIDLITEHGVGRLRTADLAKRLGVSTGLIFYHFDTLENLCIRAFKAAAERDLIRLRQILDNLAGQSATDRLRAVLHEYGPTGGAVGWRLWIESWSAALHQPSLRDVVVDLDTQWRQTVAMLIAEGVGAGEFSTPDVDGSGWRLTALLDGLAVQAVALGGTISADQIRRWMDEAMQRELGLTAGKSTAFTATT